MMNNAAVPVNAERSGPDTPFAAVGTTNPASPINASFRARLPFTIASLILALAAIGKMVELFVDCPPRYVLYRNEALVHILHIQCEMLLAAWLLSAQRAPFFPWVASVAVYSSLAVVSLANVVRGTSNCHCFGAVQTSPSTALAVNVVVLGLLVLPWRAVLATGASMRNVVWSLSWPVVVALAGGAVGAVGIHYAHTKTTASLRIEQGREREAVVLNIREWLGKPCPILELLDSQVDVSRGKWTLFLVHLDCDACRSAIRKLGKGTSVLQNEQVCIVFLPPDPADRHTVLTGSLPVARIRDTRSWYVDSPARIVLDESIVVDAQPHVVL